jgi:hypothetical protein
MTLSPIDAKFDIEQTFGKEVPVYHINPFLVMQIQGARDLEALKVACLTVMDSLLVDIINSDARREKGDGALQAELRSTASRLQRRVAILEDEVQGLRRTVAAAAR